MSVPLRVEYVGCGTIRGVPADLLERPRGVRAGVNECVIYTRISRDTEGAGLGVERQEKDCRELADQLGLRVIAVYRDNDVSAYSGKVRKGYRRMLDDLARRPRTVLVWHTDRLHRSPVELETWIALAEPHGIAVHTVQAGPLDLATPAGRMVARQLGAVARYESEHKSERIRRKMDQKAEDGEWLGGTTPFGWRRIPTDGRQLELVPAEAELITAGVRALLSGVSLRTVVRDWNASGVPPRKAPAWTRRSVRQIVRRWRNAAVHEHRSEVGGKAKWPAIPGVSVDDVRAVRAVLDDRAEGRGYGNRSAWLLSGIATCPCGQPVKAMTVGAGRRKSYRCTAGGTGHVARAVDPVDALVAGGVIDGEEVSGFIPLLLARPDVVAAFAATAAGSVDTSALRVERDRGRVRLEEIAAMYADEDITRAEYTAMRRRVAERVERIDAELAAATRTSPIAALATNTDPVAAWHAADIDVKRTIIRELVTITLLPVGPGRRRFDPATVRIKPREP